MSVAAAAVALAAAPDLNERKTAAALWRLCLFVCVSSRKLVVSLRRVRERERDLMYKYGEECGKRQTARRIGDINRGNGNTLGLCRALARAQLGLRLPNGCHSTTNPLGYRFLIPSLTSAVLRSRMYSQYKAAFAGQMFTSFVICLGCYFFFSDAQLLDYLFHNRSFGAISFVEQLLSNDDRWR